ncbi:hypothetical protein P9112_008028 [Eukaryota sp. TZLM1-RC]
MELFIHRTFDFPNAKIPPYLRKIRFGEAPLLGFIAEPIEFSFITKLSQQKYLKEVAIEGGRPIFDSLSDAEVNQLKQLKCRFIFNLCDCQHQKAEDDQFVCEKCQDEIEACFAIVVLNSLVRIGSSSFFRLLFKICSS